MALLIQSCPRYSLTTARSSAPSSLSSCLFRAAAATLNPPFPILPQRSNSRVARRCLTIARRCPWPPSPLQAGRCEPCWSPTVGLGPREAWRGVGSTQGGPLPVPHAFPNAARQRSPARWARGCWNMGPLDPRVTGSGHRLSPSLPQWDVFLTCCGTERGGYEPPGCCCDALMCPSRPCIAPCSANHELRAAPRGDSLDRFTAW